MTSTPYRLWVIGEKSPNPEDWSIWSEYALVIARCAEEARSVGDASDLDPVTEVPLTRPVLLVQLTEPNWGLDI